MDTEIIIAGGGPVGMTLSLELARHGVSSILLERNATTTQHPKMDLTNGRSMELYARLGIVESLRDVGVPRENAFDISWITNLNGFELHRFHYPSSREYEAHSRSVNDGSYPAEAPLRVSQVDIEPVLKTFVDANPLVDVRFGVAFEDILEETNDSISVRVRDEESGEAEVLTAAYLAGCDGGGSRVRRILRIPLEGEEEVAGAFMVHFHSTDTRLLQRWGTTWHYQNGAGSLIAQNDKDTWTLQAWLPPGEDGSDWIPEEVLEAWVGSKFEYKILQANPWRAHFVVASRYVKNRTLLAGDAAHQFIPTGGYGMNSGVADAVGLAWVLAANVQGWGRPALLEAYESERKPTAWWHLQAASRHFVIRQKLAELYAQAGEIDSETPEAAKRRENLAAAIAELGNAENESWGVELGYRYSSPVIFSEDDSPRIDPLDYRPSTEPGKRLPHLYLDNGQSVHQCLGKEFTLLICEGDLDRTRHQSMLSAAESLNIPLDVVSIGDTPAVLDVYQRRFLLVRPDLHIAWRGDELPDSIEEILRIATGR